MSKINKIHFIYSVWLGLAAVCLLLTGCLGSLHESKPIRGGIYEVTSGMETLAQGDNAQTATRLEREMRSYDSDGNLVEYVKTTVDLGTSRPPIITERKGHPNEAGQYTLSIIGALAIIGGAVVGFKVNRNAGIAIGGGGLLVAILGLTAGQYGHIYALVTASGIAAYLLYLFYQRRKSASQITTTAPNETANV